MATIDVAMESSVQSILNKLSKTGAKPLRILSGSSAKTSGYQLKTVLNVSGSGSLLYADIEGEFQYQTGRIELKVTIDGVVRFWRRVGTDTESDWGNTRGLMYGCPWYILTLGDYSNIFPGSDFDMSPYGFLSYPDNSSLIEEISSTKKGAYTEAIPFNSSLKVEIAFFGTSTRTGYYTVGYTLD